MRPRGVTSGADWRGLRGRGRRARPRLPIALVGLLLSGAAAGCTEEVVRYVSECPEADASPAADDASTSPEVGPKLPGALDAAQEKPDALDLDAEGAAPEVEPPEPPRVVLNEVGCHGEAWVELANASGGAPGDLTGWTLETDPFDPARTLSLSGLPALPAGEVLLVSTDPALSTAARVRCGEEAVRLVRADGSEADRVEPPVVVEAQSFGRLPDGSGEWARTRPTPGEGNALPEDPAAVLFDPLRLVEMELTLPPESIEALFAEPYEYAPGAFRLVLDGVPKPLLEVGIRLKGKLGSFQTLDGKAAFKVKFNHFSKKGRLLSRKKLTLNNMVQDGSMLHEAVTYRVLRAVGVPAPRVGYAWVRVNGLDYGLYANIETYDDVSLAERFASTRHLYEGEYGADVYIGSEGAFQVDEGSESDRSDLQALMQAVQSEPPETWFAAVSALADLEEMTRMWAAEAYLGHWDGYVSANNYFLHSDMGGRFSMLPWGADQTLYQHIAFEGGFGTLFVHCLASPECRALYEAAVSAVVDAVDGDDLASFIAQVAAGISPFAAMDPRKPYNFPAVLSAMQGALDFFPSRQEEANAYLACQADPGADVDDDGVPCSMDCDDLDPVVAPGAVELCGDGIDQDCDGTVDDPVLCQPPACQALAVSGLTAALCTPAGSFPEARALCQSQGGDLAALATAEQSAALGAAAALSSPDAPGFWLGLSDEGSEGAFVWVGGAEPTFSSWAPGQPDGGDAEDCALLAGDGAWHDQPCDTALPALCAFP